MWSLSWLTFVLGREDFDKEHPIRCRCANYCSRAYGMWRGEIASKSFHVYSNLDTADVAIGDIARFQVWGYGVR